MTSLWRVGGVIGVVVVVGCLGLFVDTVPVIRVGGGVWWFGMFGFFLGERLLLVLSPHLIWYETSSRPSGGLFANTCLGLGFCGVLFVFGEL